MRTLTSLLRTKGLRFSKYRRHFSGQIFIHSLQTTSKFQNLFLICFRMMSYVYRYLIMKYHSTLSNRNLSLKCFFLPNNKKPPAQSYDDIFNSFRVNIPFIPMISCIPQQLLFLLKSSAYLRFSNDFRGNRS